jgi:hypothetical protein
MKFFVTGRSSNYERVIEAFDQIEAAGHEVTLRWTDLPMIKPYIKNPLEASKFAQQQIQAIIDTDVYILFAHTDGTGVFTEFGAALALLQKEGKPRVFAIGNDEVRGAAMFHYHPQIEWRDSVAKILEEVVKICEMLLIHVYTI